MPATSNTIGTIWSSHGLTRFPCLTALFLRDIHGTDGHRVGRYSPHHRNVGMHIPLCQNPTENATMVAFIAWLLFRDGNVYFLAMFSLNTVVCVIGMWSDNLSWLGDLNFPLQLVLVTRLLINLRELSRSGDDIIIGSQSTSAGSHGPSDPAIEVSTVRFHDGSTLRDEEETRDNQTETGGNDATDDTPRWLPATA
ncbi:uncharacterized protein B0H18DRAFT_530751 [Fomitopsis serialis]|uniref:uncharacterized protein n=1 Tax=Fomitopsis serialis TaxID=139415 RepID=UPI00200841DE|nr:uncharacterized protein B0H18DRAFT_530751 [Neoantrodia serialis]KAH9921847.1 hypothetical protein B0H18DRAFT_530751 [Neoantrodia serialis]